MAKITKKEMFEKIKGALTGEVVTAEETAEFVDFIQHEIELLSKKSTAKVTKNQEKNEEIKEIILAKLATMTEPATITDLMVSDETLSTYANQKISALMRQLVTAGQVERIEKGKKTLFQLATATAEE